MADRVVIAGDGLSAAINPLGAELSSLKDAAGRELMTDADPAFWTGRAPLLFPVVGKPAGETIRVDGGPYTMKQHGFARRMMFAVAEQAADRATFVLTDTPETRACYPFAFRLEVTFGIVGATLSVDVSIANPGDAPLPASFGFHPAFAWPLPGGGAKEAHRIIFSADEPEPLRKIDANGQIAPEPRPSPLDGRTLHLRDDLFADDALIWDRLHSDRVTYQGATGPRLEIAFSDTPMLGIWTKPGAHFICIEPWHGIADPAGFTGDFRDKPGVFEVAPGAAKRIAMRVTLLAES
ncbi:MULTISPECIES: aldose 1-epimerase family protein [unclassified Sphingomonas]|uniref:aldose 1-epimerase family protein n=1 Tax=unclassified Sphingomonas TaxID=196159 RepID=UPI00092B573D|nr:MULTISPECIES: aldose 1-epimerase family protein [unclassified Sphingomonas]MBN8848712.1 aldose 1-epimerase family protein [Sphingomonas sp.]OJV33422.1 MAG: aldose epimerase [Sphingomonas sp. 67-36]